MDDKEVNELILTLFNIRTLPELTSNDDIQDIRTFWLKWGFVVLLHQLPLQSQMWEKCQTERVNVFWILEAIFLVYILKKNGNQKNATSIQIILTHLLWHFSYICDYDGSWWTKTTKTHFSQKVCETYRFPVCITGYLQPSNSMIGRK